MQHILPRLFCFISFIYGASAHPHHEDHAAARQGFALSAANPRDLSPVETPAPGTHEAADETVRLVLPDLIEKPDDSQTLPLAASDIAERVRIQVRSLSTGPEGNGAASSGEDDTDTSESQDEEENPDEEPDALHEGEEDHKRSVTGSLPAF